MRRWLSYKSVPNMLSVLRLALVTPFVLAICDIAAYRCAQNGVLVSLFALIILSDIADGCAARRLNCASKIGAALDLIADALYTLLSFGAFAYFKIVPAWFVLVLAVKLIEFLITSRLLGKKRRGAAGLVFDRIGKLSILLAMALPGAFVFRCVIDYRRVMGGAVYVIGALLVVSTAARIRSAIS